MRRESQCRLYKWFSLSVLLLLMLFGITIVSAADMPGISFDTGSIRKIEATTQLPCKQQDGNIIIDFEGLGNQSTILDAYAACGVVFSADALALIDSDAGGGGNFANEPSPNTTMYFTSSSQATLNFPAGMTQGFSFHYTAINKSGFIKVYSGENRTGDLLATLDLPVTPSLGQGDPNGTFDNWQKIGVTFNGVAKSIDFGGTANQIGFDNITLGSAVAADTNVTKFTFSVITDQAMSRPFPVTVSAVDQYGNIVRSFNKSVSLSSMGGALVKPLYVTFADGVATFDATFYLPSESEYLSATLGHLYGKSNNFIVAGETTFPVKSTVLGSVKSPSTSDTTVYLFKGTPSERKQVITGGSGNFKFDSVGVYGSLNIILEAENTDGLRSKTYKQYVPLGKTVNIDIEVKNHGRPVIVLPGIMGSTTLGRSDFYLYPQLTPPELNGQSIENLKLLDPTTGTNPVGGAKLVKALTEAGYQVTQVPWDWRIPFERAAEIYLKPAIYEAKKTAANNKVDVVAHSMGGLVTRAYIQSVDYQNDIDKFIMLGTPNGGSGKPYWMYDGGDPEATDNIDSSGWGTIDSKVEFYENVTENHYEQWDGHKWLTGPYGIRKKPRHVDIKAFYEAQIPTALQLMPVYNYLKKNGTLQTGTGTSTENVDLKNLNSSASPYYQSSIQRMTTADSTDANSVRTTLFVSTSEPTIDQIVVGDNGEAPLYPHGVPYAGNAFEDDFVNGHSGGTVADGDGTVLACQAAAPFFLQSKSCTSSEWDTNNSITVTPGAFETHAGLMGKLSNDVVAVLNSGRTAQKTALATAAPPPPIPSQLSLNVSGLVQPYLQNSQAIGSGVNCNTGEFEQNIPDSKAYLSSQNSIINLNSPANGIYTVCLSGIIDDNFSVEIGYGDSGGYSKQTAKGIYHSATKYNFSFMLDAASQNKITILEPVIHPTAVDASNNSGSTKISWVASTDASVSGYNIYSKLSSDPYYTLLATVNAQTNLFDTTHAWNDGTVRSYVVLSKNASGSESLYFETTENSVSMIAGFDVDKSIGIAPLIVKFTDTSLGAPTAWKWDFDADGVIDSTDQNPTFTFTQNKNYLVRLTVSGPNGSDYTTKVIGLKPFNYSIPLINGWNLVSLPILSNSGDAIASVMSNLTGSTYSLLWGYQGGAWKMYDPANTGFSDLTTMSAGNGYWMYMNGTGSLGVTGQAASKTVSMATGWNLVGYNSMTAQSVAAATASFTTNLENVWSYTNGAWQMYDPANPGFSDLASLEPGKGYWIKAKQAGTWTLP